MPKEITTDDLRIRLSYIHVNRVSFRDERLITDDHLAAFNEMVEKANRYNKIEKLIDNIGAGIKKVYHSVVIHNIEKGKRSSAHVTGDTLAEALKAVPDV